MSERSSQSGLFVTLEGPDGAGKTTLINALAHALQQHGHAVTLTRNPGGTEFGSILRKILLQSTMPIDPWAEVLLYLADRAQHRAEVIEPALKRGDIVLCDRYSDSTLAYQGYGRGLDLDVLRQLNHSATQGLQPHLTLVLLASPQALAQRLSERSEKQATTIAFDRFESETTAFKQRVYESFLTLAQHEPQRIYQLDALDAPENLSQRALQKILACL